MTRFNGSRSNAQATNSKTPTRIVAAHDAPLNQLMLSSQDFDQPVILRPSPVWSRVLIWTLMGVITAGVAWACIAQTEQAVPAQGKLEPEKTVTEVQVPVTGVVKEVRVRDGERVNKGDLLLSLDPTVAASQRTSLMKIRSNLVHENEFYKQQMQGLGTSESTQVLALLPPEELSLTRHRVALLAENQLYRIQLAGATSGSNLTLEQQARLQANQAEVNSRVNAAELDVGQLQRQLAQAQSQLDTARDLLQVEQNILADLKSLLQEGGIGRLQYAQQQKQVLTNQATVARLVQEVNRLRLAIAQGNERVQNTAALTKADVLAKITDNEKRIAEIDSQLTKAMVENEKRIAEIDSQLSQTQLTLRYQSLQAPVSGTVFDLQVHGPGYVTNTTTPVLKIVPDDALIAKVYITNRDIGFVKEGMPVDVRVDSFPFSEFGDIKGTLVWIGSDALPPDQIYSFYRFPAKIRLDRQSLLVNGREISLQSGMAVSTNMKLRKRAVITIFTDLFSRKVESLQFLR